MVQAFEFPIDDGSGSNSGVGLVDNRIELAVLDPVWTAAYLLEAGREGMFKWSDDNLSAEVAADTAQGVYVAGVGDITGATGAWVRVVEGSLNAKWFGAAGTGSVDDTAPVQAMLNYASFAAGGTGIFNDRAGITCYFPSGEYLTNIGWLLRGDGITLEGAAHRGSILSTNTAGVTILTTGFADYSAQTYFLGLEKLLFRANTAVFNATNTCGLRCHDCLYVNFTDLYFSNLYNGIELFRTQGNYDGIIFAQHERSTTKAGSAWAFKGRSTNGDTSGSARISNIEVLGSATLPGAWTNGLLIMSMDGGYFSNVHIYECDYDIHISPDGTHIGNVVTDLLFDSTYCDTAYLECVKLDGQTVPIGGGILKDGVYAAILFGDTCVFRGDAGNAGQCILVSIDAANNGARRFSFHGHVRQAAGNGIQIQGPASGKVSVNDVEISCQFAQNNYDGIVDPADISTNGVQNLMIVNNQFAPAVVAPLYCVQFTPEAAGDSMLVAGNDFSRCNATVRPINYSPVLGANVLIGTNLGLNQRHVDLQPRTTITTTTTTTTAWDYTMPVNKVLAVDFVVVGMSNDGGNATKRTASGVASRVGAAAPTWLNGPTLGTLYESDAGFDIALDLSGSDMRVRVTGLAETINWFVVPTVVGN